MSRSFNRIPSRLLVLGALIATGLAPLPAQATHAGQAPFEIASTRFYRNGDQFGNLIDGAVGRDGRVCVADFTESKVHCLFPATGRWLTFGRKGDGPGEFDAPYRIAITPDLRIWVWDFHSQDLSLFDSEGKFLGRSQIPYRFQQVDAIVPVGEDQLVFCGVTSDERAPRDSALHLFKWVKSGTTMEAVRAFGLLPTYVVRQKVEHWGAGVVSRAANGNLYYTRRVPWINYEYRIDGTLVRAFDGPEKLTVGPDHAINIAQDERSMTIGQNHAATVTYPLRILELDSHLLLSGRRTSRADSATVTWDFLNATTGQRVAELPLTAPVASFAALGYDATAGIVWGIGPQDGEDGIWAIALRPAAASAPRKGLRRRTER